LWIQRSGSRCGRLLCRFALNRPPLFLWAARPDLITSPLYTVAAASGTPCGCGTRAGMCVGALRTHARIHARWLPCALLGSKCADNTATRTRVPPRACALARGHCSNCTPSSSIPAPSPSLGAVWASCFLGGRGLSGKNRTAGRRRGSRPLVILRINFANL
jgi:hypothetical protein